MGEKVWTRDYLEKAGATVEWDEPSGTIIVDGKFVFAPEEIVDGKSYNDKETLDFILEMTGHEPLDEIPPTSRQSESMDARDEALHQYYQSASRALPGWDRFKDWAYAEIVQPVRDWVNENIWKPVRNWVRGFVISIQPWINFVGNIYNAVYNFLQKVKFAIADASAKVYNSIAGEYHDAVSWVKVHIPKLEWAVSSTNIWLISYLGNIKDKIIWLFDTAYQNIVDIITKTTDVISEHVVAGFSVWSERVFELLEDYIVQHWEDEI